MPLQAFSHTLLPPLTHIISTFPNAFKLTRVTLLLKKTKFNISLTDSYRPVSLLTFIAKMLELFPASYPNFCQRIIYWTPTNQVSDVDIQLRRRYSQSLKACGLQKLIPNHQFSFCCIICCFLHG